MKTENTALVILAGLGLIFAGCGAQSTGAVAPAQAKNMVIQTANGTTVPDVPSSGSALPTNPNSGIPPFQYYVGAVGYTSTTVQVRAGQVLKVSFSPGQANKTIPGTGGTAIYSQLGVFIKVGEYEEATELLGNG